MFFTGVDHPIVDSKSKIHGRTPDGPKDLVTQTLGITKTLGKCWGGCWNSHSLGSLPPNFHRLAVGIYGKMMENGVILKDFIDSSQCTGWIVPCEPWDYR